MADAITGPAQLHSHRPGCVSSAFNTARGRCENCVCVERAVEVISGVPVRHEARGVRSHACVQKIWRVRGGGN